MFLALWKMVWLRRLRCVFLFDRNIIANLSYERLQGFDTEKLKSHVFLQTYNKAVLNPKNIEKTRVKLAISIIHENTIRALIEYGFSDMATALQAFLNCGMLSMLKTHLLANTKWPSS